MKNILLIAVCVLCSLNSLYSQIEIGLKGGLTFSALAGDSDLDGRIGFHAGAFAPFEIGTNFYVQPEALLSLQGAEDFSNLYLNIPVVLKYEVANNFFLEGGLGLGLLVGGKLKTNFGDIKASDLLKSTDLFLPIGLSYQVSNQALIGMRYHVGLSNDADESQFGNAELKSAGLRIYAGFLLN